MVVGWAMRPVKKTRVKLFRPSFSTGSASRNSQSKKVESKKSFFDCVRKPDLGFSRKRPFSTDKSDCIINGLGGRAVTAQNTIMKTSNIPSSVNSWARQKINVPDTRAPLRGRLTPPATATIARGRMQLKHVCIGSTKKRPMIWCEQALDNAKSCLCRANCPVLCCVLVGIVTF